MKWLATLLVLFASISSEATIYYVDDGGSDSTGDGSVGNPWATLEKAWNTAGGTPVVCGDTIRVYPGNYFRENLRRDGLACGAGTRLTVEAQDPANQPVIYGSNIIAAGSWTLLPGTANTWYYTITNATERVPWELYQEKSGVLKRYKHASYPHVVDANNPYNLTELLPLAIEAPSPTTSAIFPVDLDSLDQDSLGFEPLGASSDIVVFRDSSANVTKTCPVTSWDAVTDTVGIDFAAANICALSRSNVNVDKVQYRSCRFLTEAGEYCLETSPGGISKVYVIPYDGDTPATAGLAIHLPQERWFWVGINDAGNYVTFDGFKFRFFDNYRTDTSPASETVCGGCSEIWLGGRLYGFIAKNFTHEMSARVRFLAGGYGAGSFPGGFSGGGTLFENFTCRYLVNAGCAGAGFSDNDGLLTFKNGIVNDVVADNFAFGSGGGPWAWSSTFSFGGEIVFDNVDIVGCEKESWVHQDCIQPTNVRKLTVKNSVINKLPTVNTNPDADGDGQTLWDTCVEYLTLQNNTFTDGILGVNNARYVTMTGNTFHNTYFRQDSSGNSKSECVPQKLDISGNTFTGGVTYNVPTCPGSPGQFPNCDSTRDWWNLLTNTRMDINVGCNDYSTITFGANGVRKFSIMHQWERFLVGPGVPLADTQKYDWDWLYNTGYFDVQYRLQGVESVTPAPALADVDVDAVYDCMDLCSTVANATQLDTDFDGYGQPCDADFDQDGIVGGTDFNVLRQCFGQTVPGVGPADDPTCAESDMDGNLVVGGTDFNSMRLAFGMAPGPSCCGAPPPEAPTGEAQPAATDDGHWAWPADTNWPGQ